MSDLVERVARAKLKLDADYLRQRLRYDPDTGKLYWREYSNIRPGWNERYAGKEAFTYVCTHGYLTGCVDNRRLRAHRVAWAIFHGECPDVEIDHINHIRTDNRLANLRLVTTSENARNQMRPRSNKSGVIGVRLKSSGRWEAAIRTDGRRRYLGSYVNFDDAVAARKAAERQHGYHENHGVEVNHG